MYLNSVIFFSDSDYGKKKKKRGGGRAKKTKSIFPKRLQLGGGRKKTRRDWSDESDFSDRPRKKKKARETIPSADVDRKNIVETAGRRTRGVKVNYSLLEGSSDEAEATPAPKGKGKGPRKWDGSEDEFKPDSDVEKPEDALGEEEEEDDSDEEIPSDDLEETPDEDEEKPKKGKKSRVESTDEDDEESSRDSRPDISDESEDDVPPAKPMRRQEPPKIKLLSQASPFPKAPPPNANEEDSDDGFQSPATPSEDEDDE